VEQAAQARFENGLGHENPNCSSQQQSAQSNFDVQASLGAESDARVALIGASAFCRPSAKGGGPAREKSSESQTEDSVGELIAKALSKGRSCREASNVHGKEQGFSRSAPRLSEGHVGRAFYRNRPAGQRRQIDFFAARADVGVFLNAEVPIFDGFARRTNSIWRGRPASSRERTCWSARLGCREVWKAYTGYRTALKKQDAAEKLLTASKSAFDAVLESYKQG